MKNNSTSTQNGQLLPCLAMDVSMSSKEISELLGVRHDSVLRTIKRLESVGAIALPPLVEKSTKGRPTTIYKFSGAQGKRDSIIVVAQLSPGVTARIVDRWQELEGASQFDPSKLSRSDILRIALDAEEEKQKLAAQIEEAKPLVKFAEKHAKADGWFCFRDAAKQIGIPQNAFIKWLNMSNYIFRQGGKHWMPYSEAQKRGYFEVKVGTVLLADGSEKATQQCMVTAKGIQHFENRLRKEGLIC